jgi:hypothetical protein
MLLILCCAILLSLVAIGLGHLIHKFVNNKQQSLPFADAFFLGLIAAGVYGMVLWFFVPLHIYTALPLYAFGGVGFFTISKSQIEFRKPLIWWGILAILGVLLVAKAATLSSYYDSGLYYIQTIRWMEQFAIVPGLGNVHIRLAMAAPWHMIAALFSGYPILNGSFDYLNELAYFWFIAAVLQRLLSASRNYEKWFYILLLPGIPALNSMLSSTSPDLPNALFFWWIIIWLYDAFKTTGSSRAAYFIYVVLSIAFLVCTKASALFLGLPLFAVVIMVWSTQSASKAFRLLVISSVIILLGCVKTWILCGYAYFLIPGLDFIPADWVVSKEVVEWYNNGVTEFARFKGNYILMASYNKGFAWVKHWYLALQWYERAIVWAQPFAFILGIFILNRVWKLQQSAFYVVSAVFFSVMIGSIIWWLKAPDLRFHWAALYAMPALVLTYHLRNIKIQKQRYVYGYLIIWAIANAYLMIDVRAFRQYLIKPAPYKAINTAAFTTADGKKVNYPLPDPNTLQPSDQCWDAPIPCAPKPVKTLQYRGATIQSGFKVSD